MRIPVLVVTALAVTLIQPRAEAAPDSVAAADCSQTYQLACLGADQIEQAYGLSALYAKGITGSGTTIAIVDPYGSPTIAADLGVFDAQFGLPAASLTVIQPAGAIPPYDPSDSNRVAWATETTLDVEYAHAAAPGAKILLAETPIDNSDVVLGLPQIVTAEQYLLKHYHVDVISQSFTVTEQTLPSKAAAAAGGPGQSNTVDALRGAYVQAQAQHVTVVASSGDTGAAGTDLTGVDYYTHAAASYPGSDPLVTSVGGTGLRLDANGDRTAPDTVWNDTYDSAVNQADEPNAGPNPLASGGGTSILFGRPSYQDAVANVVGNARGEPDVSMSAGCSAPVVTYQSFGGKSPGWYPSCGTSEATPLFAGVVALADQEAGHDLGLINPALYQLAAQHAAGIIPVTSGNNTVSFNQQNKDYTVRGYDARNGYSMAAGVGSIDAAAFVPELVTESAAFAGHAPLHPSVGYTPRFIDRGEKA
jgi:subtilase family serine protease